MKWCDLTLTYVSASFVLKLMIVDCSSLSFLYEKNMHNFGFGKRIIPNYYRLKEHPEPLPPSTRSPDTLRSPFKNIYQGSRKPNDVRVFRKRFALPPQNTGQHVSCEGMFNCALTHLAIETSSGIPFLLRGGVGYRYLVVVVRAKPGDELEGSVRAYCVQKHDD